MAKHAKAGKRGGTRFTIGRSGFSKISAVEGIRLSRRAEGDFREFEREGLSARERRERLIRKYGKG